MGQFYFQRDSSSSSEEEDQAASDDENQLTWTAADGPLALPLSSSLLQCRNPFRNLRKRATNGCWMGARLSGKPIYLSRHGESEYNVLDKIGGDSSLSTRGNLYAKALGRYFNSQDTSELVVWTSGLKRTLETAEFVNAAERHQFPYLNEIDSGKLDGLSYEEFATQYPDEFQERENDKLTFRYPGGESYIDCCERLVPFLEKFEEECRLSSKPLLIVAHQAILRCIYGYLLPDVDPVEIPYIKIPQHTIMQVRWTDVTDIHGDVIEVNQDCVIEYVRTPIDHAEQGVVSAALSL